MPRIRNQKLSSAVKNKSLGERKSFKASAMLAKKGKGQQGNKRGYSDLQLKKNRFCR